MSARCVLFRRGQVNSSRRLKYAWCRPSSWAWSATSSRTAMTTRGIRRDAGEDRRDQRLRDDREEDHHQPLLVRPEVVLEPVQLAEEVRLLEDARPDARLDRHLPLEIVGELRVPRLVGVDLVGVLDHRLREVEARPAPADHRRDRVDRAVLELGRELEVRVQLLDQHAVDGVGAELLDERVLRDRHELGREVDVLARLLLADLRAAASCGRWRASASC